jgi:hypothetical protein
MNVIGAAWYSPETYRRLAAMPEPRIEKTYAEFTTSFEAMERDLVARGFVVEKVPVDIKRMVKWCHRHGYDIDGRGRSAYGAVLMMGGENGQFRDNTRVLQ